MQCDCIAATWPGRGDGIYNAGTATVNGGAVSKRRQRSIDRHLSGFDGDPIGIAPVFSNFVSRVSFEGGVVKV
jgi:hypothetical protein